MWSLKGVDWQKDGRGFVVKQKEKAPSGNMCIISDVNPVLLGNQIMCWGVGFLTEKLEVCDLSPAALQLLKVAPSFITPTDCVKLLTDTFQIYSNAQNDSVDYFLIRTAFTARLNDPSTHFVHMRYENCHLPMPKYTTLHRNRSTCAYIFALSANIQVAVLQHTSSHKTKCHHW